MRLLTTCLLLSAALLNAQQGIEGTWQGELKTPGGILRLRMRLDRDATAWKGALDSLDQGANGIPLQQVRFAEGKLSWEIPALRAGFEGMVNDAQNVITGRFKQGGAVLPLELKRVSANPAEAAAPKRPQTPKAPFPYRTEEVTFASKAPRVNLAGALTIPQGKAPYPALVLVSGSGPQDRDETLFGHKPFAVIADYLARHGIAVLRYDDRGVGKSTGEFRGATTADFAQDAEGAFEYLLKRPGFKKVGIGGHSEGGLIASMLAARRNDVAFVVMLAGTGVSGEQVLLGQAAAILRANGAPDAAIESNRMIQEALFAMVRSNLSEEEMVRQAPAQLGSIPGIDQQIKTVSDPWFRYFITLDPRPILEKVTCPVLVLNGDLDVQVIADQNVPAIEAALRKGGNKKVTTMRFAKLNHLFQDARTGAPSEYNSIEETMSPTVLETMSNWIVKVTE